MAPINKTSQTVVKAKFQISSLRVQEISFSFSKTISNMCKDHADDDPQELDIMTNRRRLELDLLECALALMRLDLDERAEMCEHLRAQDLPRAPEALDMSVSNLNSYTINPKPDTRVIAKTPESELYQTQPDDPRRHWRRLFPRVGAIPSPSKASSDVFETRLYGGGGSKSMSELASAQTSVLSPAAQNVNLTKAAKQTWPSAIPPTIVASVTHESQSSNTMTNMDSEMIRSSRSISYESAPVDAATRNRIPATFRCEYSPEYMRNEI